MHRHPFITLILPLINCKTYIYKKIILKRYNKYRAQLSPLAITNGDNNLNKTIFLP